MQELILRVRELGCVPYREARDLQSRLAEGRLRAVEPDTLLLLEHPPTITIGRGADRSHLLLPPAALAALGIELVETDRGGDVTYHGPGQLVGYPIFGLQDAPHLPDLHRYLRSLEECLIRALADFQTPAGRMPAHTGVWTGLECPNPRKIAAIGIRVSRWVTQHGFALNVCTQMSNFSTIIPCGIREFGVTSMTEQVGRHVTVAEVSPHIVEAFTAVFGLDLEKPTASGEAR